MAANNTLQLSSINFDGIKDNLKTFLQNQTELEDYDYEASTMQILLNLLAYNTYMNSYYLNMVANESFLDSAQLRNNVVSRAKMLGYVPRSAQGPSAVVKLTITPDDAPDTISVPQNTQFRATIDGANYIFVNPEAEIISADSDGIYSTNLTIVEGRPLTHRYPVNTVNPVDYIIPNDNVDLTSLDVRVQQSTANLTVTPYSKAQDLTNVDSTSKVYYVDENIDERYEIKFGDNILGQSPVDGNIVLINYRVCSGEAARGAAAFSAVTDIAGYSNLKVETISNASGGGQRESIQSIKFNAPKSYAVQNRAITLTDYQTIIKNTFADIQSVSVWGGEDNTPPVYGKTFISVKPKSSLLLAEDRKQTIKDYLNDKKVLAIETEIVDPTFVYVNPTVTVKYNPDLTSATAGSVADNVNQQIVNYESNQLGLFNQSFKTSELISQIYKASDAIDSININIKIRKKFVPNTTTKTTYRIPFNRSLLNLNLTVPGNGLTVTSSKFTYQGQSSSYFDDDGTGNIRIFFINQNRQKIYTNRQAGSIDYNTGLIVINNILITGYEGDSISINVDPDAQDIDSLRNQLVLISDVNLTIFDSKRAVNVINVTNVNTQGSTSNIPETGVVATVY